MKKLLHYTEDTCTYWLVKRLVNADRGLQQRIMLSTTCK